MLIQKKPKYLWLLQIFFPEAIWEKNVIVTFSPWIFCNIKLSDALMAHEKTHIEQQAGSPIRWWIKYILSSKFRLSQEIEAHKNEYLAYVGGANARYRMLHMIADRLCGPLYKNLIKKEEAMRIIADYNA